MQNTPKITRTKRLAPYSISKPASLGPVVEKSHPIYAPLAIKQNPAKKRKRYSVFKRNQRARSQMNKGNIVPATAPAPYTNSGYSTLRIFVQEMGNTMICSMTAPLAQAAIMCPSSWTASMPNQHAVRNSRIAPPRKKVVFMRRVQYRQYAINTDNFNTFSVSPGNLPCGFPSVALWLEPLVLNHYCSKV